MRTNLTGPAEEPDDNGSGIDDRTRTRVVMGIHQLERGGFLNRDQLADRYHFHQTLRDYAESRHELSTDQALAALSGLLHFYEIYLQNNAANDSAIDRCLDNVLAALETALDVRKSRNSFDSVLTEINDSISHIFEQRGLWKFEDQQGQSTSIEEFTQNINISQKNLEEIQRTFKNFVGINKKIIDIYKV